MVTNGIKILDWNDWVLKSPLPHASPRLLFTFWFKFTDCTRSQRKSCFSKNYSSIIHAQTAVSASWSWIICSSSLLASSSFSLLLELFLRNGSDENGPRWPLLGADILPVLLKLRLCASVWIGEDCVEIVDGTEAARDGPEDREWLLIRELAADSETLSDPREDPLLGIVRLAPWKIFWLFCIVNGELSDGFFFRRALGGSNAVEIIFQIGCMWRDLLLVGWRRRWIEQLVWEWKYSEN